MDNLSGSFSSFYNTTANITDTNDPSLEPKSANNDTSQRLSQSSGQKHAFTIRLLDQKYPGNGSTESPYLINFLPDDPQNAMLLPTWKKWAFTCFQALATLATTFASSAYSGGIEQVIHSFDISQEVATLGISLYVLGFACGPLIWGPLSELYGRRKIFFFTFMATTAFSAGAAGAGSFPALLTLRFLAGCIGSAPFSNAPAVIADMFDKSERGMAMCMFSGAPFLGPAIGPIAGGFISQAGGWRWLHGLLAAFTGVTWITTTIFVPETYAPYILRKRAQKLSKHTGLTYISTFDANKPPASTGQQLRVALTRPWLLLFKEPIVFITSIYISIIYGTMYMCFAAFPIVFQKGRGWGQGIGGLAFTGIVIGVVLSIASFVFEDKRYARAANKRDGPMHPEDRLPPAMVGSILIPLGLFWFAWTIFPSVHWIVPIIGTVFFAWGLVLVFMALLNYLVDSYVIFAASVMAANSALRSLFGAAFPLFTRQMYDNLGVHWASSIPAFLALACVPFPFLFFRYGPQIRMKCKYAAEAAAVLEGIRDRDVTDTADDTMVEDEGICRA
ncbi:major facilitator superfamily domain-containing protein [Fusarium tricinctum]|uniref:Major facilitator superfamily domain-containing protein n=1 Tax=Fusarium tricinctum TaxID=61284 RepID=A0A8K0S735_9HYPO|nr:major facilitator superfamily domain-containing protein [Fusarium tricinctum]